MKKLLAYMKSDEFREMVYGPKSARHTYGEAEDLADSIGLIIICALLLFVVFM